MSNQLKMNLKDTLIAINKIKDYFIKELMNNLNLMCVDGPLIINQETGLNDNLTNNNYAVKFYVDDLKKDIEIVQSLAKWKRYALKKYGFSCNEGIVVNMNAIRAHEKLDFLHSLYVDQWDWELVINKKERNFEKLKEVVDKIYKSVLATEKYINGLYPFLTKKLPDSITFYDSQELEEIFPNQSFDEILNHIVKNDKAVFVVGIGRKLNSGRLFDSRSPDYDDWELNGDIFVWSDAINQPIELSSMGIRVNGDSLINQAKLDISKKNEFNQYYKMIIDEELDQTIGGGIGQSRLCMFLLEKKHIGEVYPSVWDEQEINELVKKGFNIL